MDARGAAVLALVGVDDCDGHLAAGVAVPDGDAVAPPDLAADAPVADVLQPVAVHAQVAFGNDLDLGGLAGGVRPALVDGPEGIAGQRAAGSAVGLRHRHEPLLADQRLDNGAAAVAGADRVRVWLFLDQKPLRLQVGDDGLARLEAILALVRPGLGGHLAVEADGRDNGQAVAVADLEVERVVPGRDLEGAGAELRLDGVVGDDRHQTANDGHAGAQLAGDALDNARRRDARRLPCRRRWSPVAWSRS